MCPSILLLPPEKSEKSVFACMATKGKSYLLMPLYLSLVSESLSHCPLRLCFFACPVWALVSPLLSSLGVSLKLIPGSWDGGWAQASATSGHTVNQQIICSFHPYIPPWQQHPLCRIWIPRVWILVGSRTDGEKSGRSSHRMEHLTRAETHDKGWISPKSQWSLVDLVHTGNCCRTVLNGSCSRPRCVVWDPRAAIYQI